LIKNFIVSGLKKLWIDEINDKFILEPFIYYELKKTNEINYFNSFEVAQHRRKTKEDLIYDNNFIANKFNKYLPIIGKRLNNIHGEDFDEQFWRKALSISFERYITFIYEVYANWT
jgi:putative transferase (TIGR04331 family)